MSFLTWVGQALGLIPQAIDAGKQAAEAIKPSVVIDPDMPALWHTVTYAIKDHPFCTVCQREVPLYFANQLCSEAVRRRNAGLS